MIPLPLQLVGLLEQVDVALDQAERPQQPGALLDLLAVLVGQVVGVGGDLLRELLVREEVDVDGVLELQVALLLDEVDVLLDRASHFEGCGGPCGPLSRVTTTTPTTAAAATSTSAETTKGHRRRGGGSGVSNPSSSSA